MKAFKLLPFAIFLLMGCKKNTIDLGKDHSVKEETGQQFSYQIDKEDYEAFKKAVKEHRSVSIDSIKQFLSNKYKSSATARTNATEADVETPSSDYILSGAIGDENFEFEPLLTGSYYYGGGILDYESYDYVPRYRNMIKVNLHFNMRGNDIIFYIPYDFSWLSNGLPGRAVTTTWSYPMSELLKVNGPKLGDFDNGWAFTNIYQSYTNGQPFDGDAQGSKQETRTVLKDINASIKLVSGVEGLGINIGAEIEGGFKVSSKYNSTSLYDISAAFTIFLRNYPLRPLHNWSAAAQCSGIQIN